MRARIARTSSRNRQQWATIRNAPPSRDAAIISSHPATDVAMGFSTITCFPLRSNAADCGAWSALGVDTTAASISGSAASASQSVVTRGIPYRSANARAVSSRWFATATISSPCSSTPRAWKSWIHPQPNSATRVMRR